MKIGSNGRKCPPHAPKPGSDADLFDCPYWYDPRDTFHNLLVLLSLLQIVGCL